MVFIGTAGRVNAVVGADHAYVSRINVDGSRFKTLIAGENVNVYQRIVGVVLPHVKGGVGMNSVVTCFDFEIAARYANIAVGMYRIVGRVKDKSSSAYGYRVCAVLGVGVLVGGEGGFYALAAVGVGIKALVVISRARCDVKAAVGYCYVLSRLNSVTARVYCYAAAVYVNPSGGTVLG